MPTKAQPQRGRSKSETEGLEDEIASELEAVSAAHSEEEDDEGEDGGEEEKEGEVQSEDEIVEEEDDEDLSTIPDSEEYQRQHDLNNFTAVNRNIAQLSAETRKINQRLDHMQVFIVANLRRMQRETLGKRPREPEVVAPGAPSAKRVSARPPLRTITPQRHQYED